MSISQLKSQGWAVVTDGNKSHVYRNGTKATEFTFEDNEEKEIKSYTLAWQWLKTFVETI